MQLDMLLKAILIGIVGVSYFSLISGKRQGVASIWTAIGLMTVIIASAWGLFWGLLPLAAWACGSGLAFGTNEGLPKLRNKYSEIRNDPSIAIKLHQWKIAVQQKLRLKSKAKKEEQSTDESFASSDGV